MKQTHRLRHLIPCAIAVAALAACQSDALALINPSFDTGDFTGWSTFGQGWRTSGGGDAHTGAFGVVDDVQTTDVDSFRGVFQLASATPGVGYYGGAWIRAVNVESSESWFELQFLDVSSNVLLQVQSTHVTADQPFIFEGVAPTTAPAGTVFASVRGIVQMISAPTVNTDFQIFDDFVFADVPEPNACLLITTGMIGVICLLRRKNL